MGEGGGRRHAGGTALEAERALDLQHELEVQVVARVTRDDVADDGTAEERQVADEVENLVADELITIAEAVEDAALAEDHGVLERTAARQPLPPHLAEVLEEAVGARGREVLDEHSLAGRARERERPDGGMVVVERVADAERVRGRDVDPSPA